MKCIERANRAISIICDDKAYYKSLSGQYEHISPFVVGKMKGYGD